MRLDDRVTQYVPELAAADAVDWGNVTLGALASHLAGIGKTCALTAALRELWYTSYLEMMPG